MSKRVFWITVSALAVVVIALSATMIVWSATWTDGRELSDGVSADDVRGARLYLSEGETDYTASLTREEAAALVRQLRNSKMKAGGEGYIGPVIAADIDLGDGEILKLGIGVGIVQKDLVNYEVCGAPEWVSVLFEDRKQVLTGA